MIRKDLGVYLTVISHARPENVQKMEEIVGPATWFVGEGDGLEYDEAGAGFVVESGGLCPSRNAAMIAAWEHDLPCVELSDDLRKLEQATMIGDKPKARPSDFVAAVNQLHAATRVTGAKFAGCAPTSNAFYYSPTKPIHTAAFIVGDFVYIKPCELFWDEQLKLKEDYDYTLQHLKKYGRIARCNGILASFAHRSNKGGAVAFRTPDREQEAIAYLKSKWGSLIRDNPKRPNEILLKLPKAKRAK